MQRTMTEKTLEKSKLCEFSHEGKQNESFINTTGGKKVVGKFKFVEDKPILTEQSVTENLENVEDNPILVNSIPC